MRLSNYFKLLLFNHFLVQKYPSFTAATQIKSLTEVPQDLSSNSTAYLFPAISVLIAEPVQNFDPAYISEPQ